MSAMITGYTDFFYWEHSLKDHLRALNGGKIGAFIHKFLDENEIPITNADLPENCHGVFAMQGLEKGKILTGDGVNALILGHEGRHAWQYNTLKQDFTSPEEFVLRECFFEADARAIHFGLTLQIMHNLRSHIYCRRLKDILTPYEKEFISGGEEEIARIVKRPEVMAQTMRESFDKWIIHWTATQRYDDNIIKNMNNIPHARIKKGSLRGQLANLFNLPHFKGRGIRPDYPESLAQSLGFTGDPDIPNYLLDTTGPALNSDFYTRICNYRVEREADKIAQELAL